MHFHKHSAELFIPDGLPEEQALARTTHMAIAAHQDDIEIMAAAPILACFQQEDLWFSGVVMTDGRGSLREDLYKDYSDEAMRKVRFKEQKKAAIVGEYAAMVLLDYPSKVIKDARSAEPVEDLAELLKAAHPQVVYTHNLADKHDTHIATAVKVIHAIRGLPEEERPNKLYGCEVWRDLDWMLDSHKVCLDLSKHENLQAALLGVFDSQICGAKRYDLASMGRRKANATYFESHGVDAFDGLSFAMDLTPLIANPDEDITAYIQMLIQRFMQDVTDRLERVG
jgi:LmbE family N-acetylglucosaminyl deacetylase